MLHRTTILPKSVLKCIYIFLTDGNRDKLVLSTLIYIIIAIVAIIIIVVLLQFLIGLFFIGPIGIDAIDLENFDRLIFSMQPSYQEYSVNS
jgi:hypothetical protein